MSFIRKLEEIRINASNAICADAKYKFDNKIKEELNEYAKLGLSSGTIDMSIEIDSEWFKDLKQLYDFDYSSDALKWLIDATVNNPLFDGVNMWLPPNCNVNENIGIIRFRWYISKDQSASITHSLKGILEENNLLITNNTKANFNNQLREAMKSVAGKGLSKGDFSFYEVGALGRILSMENNRDLCKWLVDKTLEEQKDLDRINIHLHPIYSSIVFKW